MRHPAAFCNRLQNWLRGVDMAVSETCGASAGRYGVGGFESVGHHGRGDQIASWMSLRASRRPERQLICEMHM